MLRLAVCRGCIFAHGEVFVAVADDDPRSDVRRVDTLRTRRRTMRDDLASMGVECLPCGQRNRVRLERWRWVAGFLFVLAAAPAIAQSYYLEDLGTLGGAASVAQAINDSGDVVGWALIGNDPGSSQA